MADLSLGSVLVPMALADAGQAVRAALASEGFGVLSEIDVSGTLQAKLGVTRAPLVVLGACNPSIADRALQVDPDASLVLPCNVVLAGEGDERTRVSIADPRAVLPSGGATGGLSHLAEEASTRLAAVLAKLSSGS